MKKRVKQVLFWLSIPLVTAGLTMIFRASPAHWFGYEPVLQCPRTVDMGVWNLGEAATGHLEVKNIGKSVLSLKDFSTSCSCIKVEREIDGHHSPLRKIDLSPGEEAGLVVSFGIGAEPGESQSATVYFQTNDPSHPVWQCDFIISRVGGAYFAQPSAVIFGPLAPGEKPRRTIDLFNNRVANRKVESICSTHPELFSVKLLPLSDEDKQRVHPTAGDLVARIEVMPCSDRPGPIAGEIHVSLVNEKHRTPPISVLGEVISPVICRPAMLVLPRRIQGQWTFGGDVLIFHRQDKPIDIILDTPPPEISAEVKAVEGRTHQRLLHIEWHRTAISKTDSTTETRLRLRVRSGGEETKLEVPVFLTENRS
jgi:hypothetical protein